MASKVSSGKITVLKAVQEGLLRPFGTGEVNVPEALAALEERGYAGRYVLEQDTAVMGEAPAAGVGSCDDVRTCLDYLAREVEPRLTSAKA